MLEEPDYEFDGYLCTSEGEKFYAIFDFGYPKRRMQTRRSKLW